VTDESPENSPPEWSPSNVRFVEKLYEKYRDDPEAVDPSWQPIFEEYFGDSEGAAGDGAPSFRSRSIFEPALGTGGAPAPAADNGGVPTGEISGATFDPVDRPASFAARVRALLQVYRLHGHLVADIDPIGRDRPRSPEEFDPERYGLQEPDLDPAEYGLVGDDLEAKLYCEGLFPEPREATVREVIERAEELYCDSIGVEYQDIPRSRTRAWLREQIEEKSYAELEGDRERRRILQRLIEAESFESFLHQKYVGAKRFALTGGDSLIPMLDVLLDELGQKGVEEVVLGMAHRGRLNVLHNIMGKPADLMISEFEEDPEPEEFLGSSDVKYHMGYSSDFHTRSGDDIHLSLCFNPSHLEYVNPVALGRTRAKQTRRGLPDARRNICPLLLHGDASFSGQGIVAESLNLARLEGFTVGGTIHVVINNQIGFTTEPKSGRSTTYATDVAQMLEVPIFHVNVHDPEACVRVMKLAARYRQLFQEDVIIDLVCYRRYGHNEGDEPRFTQPEIYNAIDGLDRVYERYADDLVEAGVIEPAEYESYWDERFDMYRDVYEEVHDSPALVQVDSMKGVWESYEGGEIGNLEDVDTSVDEERLRELGRQLAEVPDEFTPHRTLGRLLDMREEMTEGEEPINWPFAEALATASLSTDGVPFRLSGQDSIRGTFSHRHAALFDTETGEEYWPARHLDDDQARYEVYNSMLSEAAVLGFEYGFSLDYPDSLTGWEAQFGDFSNGAQVIIDQFVSSAEDKWERLSGLVMLLPHGYEGQGPEHSSARLERYLQLCADDNMSVCNLTTPAQYFHVLRRQVLAEVRKPLIIMTPKSLLRHELATSKLEALSDGGFETVIPDRRDELDPDQVDRVLMCSGKVYYDLLEFSREHGVGDVGIVRVEQLYPLDRDALTEAIAQFPNCEELVWVQEEPRNMGAWGQLLPSFLELFGEEDRPSYVGRVESSSPATGSKASHKLEQKRLLEKAFKSEKPSREVAE